MPSITKQQNRFQQAVAGAICLITTPQKEGETRRMRHNRIAEAMEQSISATLRRQDVEVWAVYGGEDKWGYTVKVGGFCAFLKCE